MVRARAICTARDKIGNNIGLTRDVLGAETDIIRQSCNNQLSKQRHELWIFGSLPVDHCHNCCVV